MTWSLVVTGVAGRRIAVALDHHRALALEVDDPLRPHRTGAIHRVLVRSRVPALGAIFVDLGDGTEGLMDLPTGDRLPALRPGATLLAEITDEARDGKAATLSPHWHLRGWRLVHEPEGKGVGVSRRLALAAEARTALLDRARDLLRPLGGGWVMRRAAVGADDGALAMEAAFLAEKGVALLHERSGPPRCLREAPSAPLRLVLDMVDAPQALLVDQGVSQEMLLGQMGLVLPIPHPQPIDEAALDAVSDALRRVQGSEVPLPDGGRLTLEPTRAVVAVDVDQGAARDRARTNETAMEALVEALRLRNIGGHVVIDPLRPRSGSEVKRLVQALEQAVERDPRRWTVFGRTRGGLIEAFRSRVGWPVDTDLRRLAPDPRPESNPPAGALVPKTGWKAQ